MKDKLPSTKEYFIEILKDFLKKHPKFNKKITDDVAEMISSIDKEFMKKYDFDNPILAQLFCLRTEYSEFLFEIEEV